MVYLFIWICKVSAGMYTWNRLAKHTCDGHLIEFTNKTKRFNSISMTPRASYVFALDATIKCDLLNVTLNENQIRFKNEKKKKNSSSAFCICLIQRHIPPLKCTRCGSKAPFAWSDFDLYRIFQNFELLNGFSILISSSDWLHFVMTIIKLVSLVENAI